MVALGFRHRQPVVPYADLSREEQAHFSPLGQDPTELRSATGHEPPLKEAPATLQRPSASRGGLLHVHLVLEEQLRSLQSYLDGWVLQQERLLGFAVAELDPRPSLPLPAKCLDGQRPPHSRPSRAMLPLPEAAPGEPPERVSLQVPGASGADRAAVDASVALQDPAKAASRLVTGQLREAGRVPNSAPDKLSGETVPPIEGDFVKMRKTITWSAQSLEGPPSAKLCRCRLLERIERSFAFQAACSTVILLNAVFLAFSAEYHINNIHSSPNQVLVSVEALFIAAYTLELLLRITVHQIQFFVCSGCARNWFDLLLVISGLHEVLSEMLTTSGGGSNFSYLRAARLLKMLKFLRIVRLMRSLRELRLVLDSILGSMRCMLWSMVLITSINFMFGVCFVHAASEYLSWGSSGRGGGDAEVVDALLASWGSMGTAMLSLLQASTGGADWADKAEPLWACGAHYYAIFVAYICLQLFVIMNSVMSMVIDGMREFSEKDQAFLLASQLSKKEEFMGSIAGLYGGTGEVSLDDFKSFMADPQILAFADSLEIEANDLEQFFGILSGHGQRSVDLENFVVGCMKLRGVAKSMDLIDLMMLQKRAADEHRQFAEFCKVQFGQLNRRLP